MLIKRLNLLGYQGLAIRNTFFQSENEASEHLAIIFPGMNYSVERPGLYYPSLVLRSRGADVLHVDYDYTAKDFQSLPDAEQYQWIVQDALAAYRTAGEQRDYTQLTLIGKSIGTLALGHLLVNEQATSKESFIWLTPLLRNEALRRQIMSIPHQALFVIGTADQHYDPILLAEVEKATGGESLVFERANHSLEIPGKPSESVRIMQKIVEKLERFIR